MKKLYSHQQRFLDKNPDKALLVWETGTGKTLAACEWLKRRTHLRALVVCPKAIKDKWRRDLHEAQVSAAVITRDEIKKTDLNSYSCLVIDEAHDFASPLFNKQRSARATVLYSYVRAHPDAPMLLLTATPIRSTPWNIHTLGCYIGQYIDVKKFRYEFEYMSSIYGRMHYELVKDWRTKVRKYVEEIADIVLLKDCVDVPPQTEEVVKIAFDASKMPHSAHYESPSEEWYARHRSEQGEAKLKHLMGILDGYRKAIVVCNYTEQIAYYQKELSKDRAVFVLQGSTKNPDEVIEKAKASDDGIFIIQSSMGAGFDASEFSVVIFASLSFKYIDYVQMKGRVKRINNLHENHFIHMLGGKCDESVYNKIKQGKDFDVHHAHAQTTETNGL